MAEYAVLTAKRFGRDVHVRMVSIPDDPDDPDAYDGSPGVGVSRRLALQFAWILARVALSPRGRRDTP